MASSFSYFQAIFYIYFLYILYVLVASTGFALPSLCKKTPNHLIFPTFAKTKPMHHHKYIPFGHLDTEIKFSFSRSSGPGGQSVNKLNTRAELRFSIMESALLLEDDKQVILEKLKGYINKKENY